MSTELSISSVSSVRDSLSLLLIFFSSELILIFLPIGLLPELLAQTNMDLQATQRLREELSKFSLWLSKNSEKYFRTEYISAEDAVVKQSVKASN